MNIPKITQGAVVFRVRKKHKSPFSHFSSGEFLAIQKVTFAESYNMGVRTFYQDRVKVSSKLHYITSA